MFHIVNKPRYQVGHTIRVWERTGDSHADQRSAATFEVGEESRCGKFKWQSADDGHGGWQGRDSGAECVHQEVASVNPLTI